MRTYISLSILVLISVMGCDTTKKTLAMADQNLTGSYTVKTMNNVAPMTKAPKFSFSTEDNSFQGNTGCNSVFGNFSTEDQELNLSQLAVSEMYCPEEGVMETEREFLDILHNIGSYEIKDNMLIFYSKEDKTILLEASIGITR